MPPKAKTPPTRADLERELVAEDALAAIDPDDLGHRRRADAIREALAGELPDDPAPAA